MNLDNMSVEDLERLRKKVQEKLTQRKSEAAGLTEFSFENPDDRSYGSIRFKAQTKHGLLAYKAMVASNYFDDIETTLNGEEDETDCDGLPEGEFGNDTTEERAKELCAEFVARWTKAHDAFRTEEES